MTEDGWVRLAASDAVRQGRVTVVRVGIRQLGATRIAGAVHAFRNPCPHAGAPLSGGELRGTTIVCSRHGWAFDVVTGACPAHPIYSLSRIEVREVEGSVFARLPPED
ncbi:MAG: Rieske 2Fe-2S domain-containing protein [Myxococcales bacterium]|nr:Rieske 2Fe-2S domain-containing protein [Myxococcales bacterium]MCB9531041.1 Rieske 2Fe-2S domain-containing protein [Myxococcales bacterium]MCB9532951.1 Rieske 2Fe-2S domain-containing protein [Myxococcales bacterium]